jgi:outer membrane lipoprotein-sorting protein
MALSPAQLSPRARRTARYAVPLGAAAATALAVLLPSAASGTDHPPLPAKTAAQLLAAVEQASLPDFSGTTVETARLGLPSLPDGALAGLASGGESTVQQLITLLTGSHTAQLAYAGPAQQRAAIFLDDLTEMDVVHNGNDLWTYASQGNSVTHSSLAERADGRDGPETGKAPAGTVPLDPTQAATQALAKIDPSTAVTVDPTARVAGRPAYQLVLAPKDAHSLIGSVRIAIDAATSMPLRVQVWPRGSAGSPAFEVGFTSLTLRTPSASTFAFTTPPGATVSHDPFSGPARSGPDRSAPGTSTSDSSVSSIGTDWTAVVTGTLPKDTGGSGPEPAIRTTTADGRTYVTTGPPKAESVSNLLDQMATPVPGGHLITTALLSVFITDDGHFYAGAVDPTYLRSLATQAGA